MHQWSSLHAFLWSQETSASTVHIADETCSQPRCEYDSCMSASLTQKPTDCSKQHLRCCDTSVPIRRAHIPVWLSFFFFFQLVITLTQCATNARLLCLQSWLLGLSISCQKRSHVLSPHASVPFCLAPSDQPSFMTVLTTLTCRLTQSHRELSLFYNNSQIQSFSPSHSRRDTYTKEAPAASKDHRQSSRLDSNLW